MYVYCNCITLLYAHIKNTFLLIIVFCGVDSKSEIHFFQPTKENPDNPGKYFRTIKVFQCRTKKWTSELNSADQKTHINLVKNGKLPLSQRFAVVNSEYHDVLVGTKLRAHIKKKFLN